MFVLAAHKRRMEALFKEGRYSTATRVLEQTHQAVRDPVWAREEEEEEALLQAQMISSRHHLQRKDRTFTFSSEDVQYSDASGIYQRDLPTEPVGA